jgi:NTE family protein
MPRSSREEPEAPGEPPRPKRRQEPRPPPRDPSTERPTDPYLPLPEAERQGIGLCLSGAGFRAALFHLGVLQRLDELEILGKLWTISSISGGSIAAAHLATRVLWPVTGRTTDWNESVAEPFRRLACSNFQPLRRLPRFLSTVFRDRFLDDLPGTLERRLTPMLLRELPAFPNFVFAGRDPTAPSLADAVAASVETFSTDHLAVEPVWRDHQVILVSDGGSLLDRDPAMEREARALGKRWLIASFKTGMLTGAYWGIGSARPRYGVGGPIGYSKEFAREGFARIRGDLDGLAEADALMVENHGYLVADAAVEAHVPELVKRPAPPLEVPHPDWMWENRTYSDD